MSHNDDHNTGTVMLSFLVGGIIGAGVALLLAPRSGRETRKKIREFADDVREQTDEVYEQVKGKVLTSISDSKDFVADQKAVIAAAIEAGKEAYEKEKAKHSGK